MLLSTAIPIVMAAIVIVIISKGIFKIPIKPSIKNAAIKFGITPINDKDKFFVDDDHYQSNKIINYIDQFQIHDKSFTPNIPHSTGFSLSLLNGKSAHIHEYKPEKSEVYHCLSGEWEIDCDGDKVVIKEKDTINKTLKLANQYGEKAKQIMEGFENNPL